MKNKPQSVDKAIDGLVTALNNCCWSSQAARSKGMLVLEILKIGTEGEIDVVDFTSRVVEMIIRKMVPMALYSAASLGNEKYAEALEAAADRCKAEGTQSAVWAAYEVAKTAYDDINDTGYTKYARDFLASFAECLTARLAKNMSFIAECHAYAAAANAARTAECAAHLLGWLRCAKPENVGLTAYEIIRPVVDVVTYVSTAERLFEALDDTAFIYFTDNVVEILLDMEIPVTKWLDQGGK